MSNIAVATKRNNL